MKFKSLSLFNFRNIKTNNIVFNSNDIIFKGINAQGKTNILEAIYAISFGSSFRTNNSKDMIKFNENGLHIVAKLIDEEDELKIDYYLKNKRQIFINDKTLADRKDLIYKFTSIIFSHEDINFVKGDPEDRRKFFNQTFSLLNVDYFDYLRDYKYILKQRNAALKEEMNYMLDLYDSKLAKYGLYIMNERKNRIEEFNKIFPLIYNKISLDNKQIYIKYKSSWSDFNSEEEIKEYLKNRQEKDIILKTTTSGVHRDQFIIMDENGPFINTASTGQLRLASLILRLAQSKYYFEKTQIKPILLIDDVLLELDSDKRKRFLSLLDNYSQAFYTFLPNEIYYSEGSKNYEIYDVKDGLIEKI